MSAFPKPSSWAVSVILHVGAFAWLLASAARAGEPPPPPPPPFEIQMTPPPPPIPTPAPPEPTAPSPPPPELIPRSSPVTTSPPPSPPPPPTKAAEPAPPPEAAPLDLTGTTLADDRGAFAVRAGNGAPMTGPIGPGGGGALPPPAPSGRPGSAGPAAPPPPKAPELTPRESLSKLPSPPDLSGALLASYPEKAKAAGERGRATVSLIVHADGRVGGLEVRSATAPEFAEACLGVLRGSRWGAPLDKDGRLTASRVGYTCQFDVR